MWPTISPSIACRERSKTVQGKQANRADGSQYQLNLFEVTHEEDLNGLENKVATYLDQQERLFFWFRNRARKDYYVQGWRRGKIYADFIFTLQPGEPEAGDEFHQVFVVETKGIHIKDSSDTAYKRGLLEHLLGTCRQEELGRISSRPCATRW